jgi:hypothetical protein
MHLENVCTVFNLFPLTDLMSFLEQLIEKYSGLGGYTCY